MLLRRPRPPAASDAREALARFAELEKSPEHVHTYRISPLSLWNAASAGLTIDDVEQTLQTYAKYPVPPSLLVDVREQMERYGRLRIVADPDTDELTLAVPPADVALLEEVSRDRHVAELLGDRLDQQRWGLRLRTGARSSRRCCGWAGRLPTRPATATAPRSTTSG
ncbi:MAG: helicase-associated domain-containing protein [Acidimicrobiia bacterium]|nr:helicase-associated domain-containing protein [Acidimicrobiia bacterium]